MFMHQAPIKKASDDQLNRAQFHLNRAGFNWNTAGDDTRLSIAQGMVRGAAMSENFLDGTEGGFSDHSTLSRHIPNLTDLTAQRDLTKQAAGEGTESSKAATRKKQDAQVMARKKRTCGSRKIQRYLTRSNNIRANYSLRRPSSK